jgi:hypothetical protein
MSKIDPVRWRELSPFLDAMLELASEERAAWLDALRVDQPRLAADLQEFLAELQVIEQERFLE